MLSQSGLLLFVELHQYLRENKEIAPSAKLVAFLGSKAEAEKLVVSTSMNQLLLDQSREGDTENLTACKAITGECDTARASIADICKRLDSSLSRTANITFATSVDSSAARPLSKDEERCFVKDKSAVSDEMERRSCILDRVNGSRRFELAHKFVDGDRHRYAHSRVV